MTADVITIVFDYRSTYMLYHLYHHHHHHHHHHYHHHLPHPIDQDPSGTMKGFISSKHLKILAGEDDDDDDDDD